MGGAGHARVLGQEERVEGKEKEFSQIAKMIGREREKKFFFLRANEI